MEQGTPPGNVLSRPPDQARKRPAPIRRLVLVVAALVLLPGLVVLGARLGTDPRLVRSPLLGKPAPAFDLARFDAPGRISSAGLAGRLYVVNFWASWCVPCVEETPILDRFYARMAGADVELLGVVFADEDGAARRFRQKYGGAWPLLDDPKSRTALDFGVYGVPETYVVDSTGTVRAKLLGGLRAGTLEDVVRQVGGGCAPVYSENDRYRRAP